MNVKPGDMAKVIGNELGSGSIVEVLRSSTEDDLSGVIDLFGLYAVRVKGPWWVVRLLNGSSLYDQFDGGRGYAMPGEIVQCRDAALRRIDPKADDAEDSAGLTLDTPNEAVPA
jgi:hypothetical protein